jgi:serine/threonine protein kinase
MSQDPVVKGMPMPTFDPLDVRAGTNINGQFEIIQPLRRKNGNVKDGGQAKAVYLVAAPFASSLRRDLFMWRIRLFGITPGAVARYKLGAMKIAKSTAEQDIVHESDIIQKIHQKSPYFALHYNTHFQGSAKLAHIVTINEQQYRYITFVYECGGTLDEFLTSVGNRPLKASQVVHLIYQIACAIEDLHNLGLTYNDLSPVNIMFSQEISSLRAAAPTIRLIDFGAVESRGQEFFRRPSLGKRLYIPPERINQSTVPMSVYGDIYSLGVLMYKLLVGTIEFHSKTALLKQAKKDLSNSPIGARRQLSPDLNDLVMDAINFNPRDRAQKIPDLAVFKERIKRLEEWKGSGALRKPMSPLQRATAGAAVALAVVVLALLIMGAIRPVIGTPQVSAVPTITAIPTPTVVPTVTRTPTSTPTPIPTTTRIPRNVTTTPTP